MAPPSVSSVRGRGTISSFESVPRWAGLEWRKAAHSTARRLQLQRRARLTAEEQDELDRINRELGLSSPKVEMA